MAKNIVTLPLSTPDTKTEAEHLQGLKDQLAYFKQSNSSAKMVPIIEGAIRSLTAQIEEHRQRLIKMSEALASNRVLGWQLVRVALREDDKVADMFQYVDVSDHLWDDYEGIKGTIHHFLHKNFKECTSETLVSSDYYFGGEVEEYKRFYNVSDCTDVGHNWNIPLVRYRLEDNGNSYEVYVKPILK